MAKIERKKKKSEDSSPSIIWTVSLFIRSSGKRGVLVRVLGVCAVAAGLSFCDWAYLGWGQEKKKRKEGTWRFPHIFLVLQ